jgi:hypothetical protein
MTVDRHIFETNKVEDMMQVIGSGQLIAGTSNGVVDTESVHAHNLGRVPRGFVILSKDKAGDFYDSTGHSTTELKIKNTVVSVQFLAWIF